MNYSWITKTIDLNFRLGVRTLFRRSFQALVLDAHFTSLTENLNQSYSPPGIIPSQIEAILISSYPVGDKFCDLIGSMQMIRYVPGQFNRYYIDLSGDFAQYLSKFSSASRKKLKRTLRKFAEFSGGEIRWREYRESEELAEFYQLARELSQKTYQEILLEEGLPKSAEFQQEMLDLAARDLARGYLLFHGDCPIAYTYCRAQGDALLLFFVGYDRQYQDWSPGTILYYLSIERLFAEGRFRLFDLGEGDYKYKKFFSTASIRCADIYYFRSNFRNRLLLRLHSGWNTILRMGSNSLERIHLKSSIKRWAKSHAIIVPLLVGYEGLVTVMIVYQELIENC